MDTFMNSKIEYKRFIETFRKNVTIRLQQKTNYGRNELYNILDAAMIDTLADVLEKQTSEDNNDD